MHLRLSNVSRRFGGFVCINNSLIILLGRDHNYGKHLSQDRKSMKRECVLVLATAIRYNIPHTAVCFSVQVSLTMWATFDPKITCRSIGNYHSLTIMFYNCTHLCILLFYIMCTRPAFISSRYCHGIS